MARKSSKRWIQGAVKRPGALGKKATAAGMTTSAYANKVLKKGSTASSRTKKQAQLAKTFAGFRKKAGNRKVRSRKS